MYSLREGYLGDQLPATANNIEISIFKKYLLCFWYCFLKYLAALGLSCSTWDLVPWPGIEPRSPALAGQSLSHWIAREVPEINTLTLVSLWTYKGSSLSHRCERWDCWAIGQINNFTTSVLWDCFPNWLN